MGAMGMVGVSSILNLGMGGMVKNSSSSSSYGNSGMVTPRPSTPVVPETVAADDGRTANPQMETERDKERQAALLRSRQGQEIFTSGLGAAGLAGTSKKTLLGG